MDWAWSSSGSAACGAHRFRPQRYRAPRFGWARISRIKNPAFVQEGGIQRIALQLGGDDRIRTGDKGFADPRLNHLATSPSGAGDGIRTRDLLLGKEMLYP